MVSEMIKRPQSLHEIPDFSSTFEEFGMSCRDFIGEWNHPKGSPAAMLSAEPKSLAAAFPEGAICDAFLAGMAEFYSEKEGLTPPPWSLAPNRFLSEEWCSEPPGNLRELFRKDTPAAFLRRRPMG